MATDPKEIRNIIHDYLLQHLLKEKNVTTLSDETPLISAGLLDSISTMQLVVHIERTFHIEFEAHEVDKDNFDRLSSIVALVSKKL